MASISTCASELGSVLVNATCKVLQSIAVNETGQKDGLFFVVVFSPSLFFSILSLLRCKKRACMMIDDFCRACMMIDGFFRVHEKKSC